MDTPGVHKAKTKLGVHMLQTVKDSVSEIDIVLMVIDTSKKIGENEANLIETFKASHTPVILILNKIDLNISHLVSNEHN